MAIFGPKPWVNPFRKMSIFRLFELLVFIAQKGIFFLFQNIVKHIFVAYIALKKKLENGLFLDQNYGLTPLETCKFFRIFELLVFIAQKGVFFVLEYCKRLFPGLYCLKVKLGKMGILDQNHGLTPLEKCQFFDFLNFLFLQLRKAFFRSRIS